MYSRYLLAILMLVFTLSGCSKEPATPQEEVRQTIISAIAVLEQGKYTDMVEYADISENQREDLRQHLSKDTDERNRKMKILLEVLKSIKDQQPTMSENNTKVTYKINHEGTPNTMEFKKIDGKWRFN